MSYAKTAWVDRVTPVSAAQLNRIEAGVDDLYNKTAFKVYRNTALSVTDGTRLTFDATEYDPDNLYQRLGTYPNFFICPRSGLWSFIAQYMMTGSPGSLDIYYSVRFWRNPAGNAPGGRTAMWFDGPRTPNRGVPIIVQAAQTIYLDAGDTLSPYASIGAAIPLSPVTYGDAASAGMPTWFAGHQVRAA